MTLLIFKRKEDVPFKKIFMVELIYTFAVLAVAIISAIFALPISMIIGVTGAFVGFIIIYLCPARMHAQCIKNKKIYNAHLMEIE